LSEQIDYDEGLRMAETDTPPTKVTMVTLAGVKVYPRKELTQED
jgi:hypothetical protein